MAHVSKKEKAGFRRSVVKSKASNLAKRIQPRGGVRR